MATNPHQQVGLSLVAKSPWALLVSVILLTGALFAAPVNVTSVAVSALSGIACSGALLCYWRAKGGIFFIIALLMPLFGMIFSDVANFFTLAQVICAFFFGYWGVLVIYKLVAAPKMPPQ